MASGTIIFVHGITLVLRKDSDTNLSEKRLRSFAERSSDLVGVAAEP
jgi:hypothetical protein